MGPSISFSHAEASDLPITLEKFLDALCERERQLHIHVLAWDFHMIFALEREWMQTLLFDWTTHERLHFRFDSGTSARATSAMRS